jgi:threonine dehydratase
MTQLGELDEAMALVHSAMPPTPQIRWPLLAERCGCDVWVKHENHTAIGSFKVRGALVYLDALRQSERRLRGVVAITKGNFGQGVAFAAQRFGLLAAVVVPRANSVDKNASMRALRAELLEFGEDFEEAYAYGAGLAEERGWHLVPSFHPLLVTGVASYSLELFRAVTDLDTLYVPIGQGSGICGALVARDALRRKTAIVGVVSERLPAYARSFDEGRCVSTPPAVSVADGMSIRVPVAESLETIRRGVARVITVSEEQIAAAMRHYFTDTHNVAEGAGAVALAGLMTERELMSGKKVGVVLTGGNVDWSVYQRVLAS